MTIQEDATAVLAALAKHPQREMVRNQLVADALDMSPDRLNDAVSVLDDSGYVKALRVMGTAPFDFLKVYITPQGRYELERAQAEAQARQQEAPEQALPAEVRPSPTPVGSPFGFTPQDWEYILLEQRSPKLAVIFGCQWDSTHYDTDKLIHALTEEFRRALEESSAAGRLTLDFKPLKAGYGEHLFNQIARSIIAADIGIFETSDFNPNVMIEMGVALTWGTRVHPIREESTDPPPSDISGQTWACYRDSGATWMDPRHFDAVVHMVELAARRKLSRL